MTSSDDVTRACRVSPCTINVSGGICLQSTCALHDQTSSFKADLGYIFYMPDDVTSDPELKKLDKSAQEFLIQQVTQLKVVQDRMSKAQERIKFYNDKNKRVQNFEVNDLMLLDGKNLDIRHKGYAQSKKLAPRS